MLTMWTAFIIMVWWLVSLIITVICINIIVQKRVERALSLEMRVLKTKSDGHIFCKSYDTDFDHQYCRPKRQFQILKTDDDK